MSPIPAGFETLTPEEKWQVANVAAWSIGNLSHLLLPGAQLKAYEAVLEWEKLHPNDPGPVVIHIHRAAGKSVLLWLLAMERALRHPGEMIRIGGPLKIETEGIFHPIIRMVAGWRPGNVLFEKVKDEYRVTNPNWPHGTYSTIHLFGCRELADSQRGYRANLILVDEARNIERLGYIVREALGPQLGRKDRPLIVLASTSPRTTSHEFWDFADEAERAGRYFRCPVTDNPDFSERDEKVLVQICGGKDTVAWRREALCAREADESLLALPSFMRNRKEIVQEVETPKFYFPFVFADLGFIDATAVLFAYVHYQLQKLVVLDEIVVTGKGTQQLADLVKAKESTYFKPTSGDLKGHHYDELRRWADDTKRGLEDFACLDLHFAPAQQGQKKWHKWRGLANLEGAFHQGDILIHPRCRSLIYQCENAIRNEHQTDLEREKPRDNRDPDTPIMGHADGIWALAYGLWQTKHLWLDSPLPPPQYSPERFFIPTQKRESNVRAEKGLAANVTYGAPFVQPGGINVQRN